MSLPFDAAVHSFGMPNSPVSSLPFAWRPSRAVLMVRKTAYDYRRGGGLRPAIPAVCSENQEFCYPLAGRRTVGPWRARRAAGGWVGPGTAPRVATTPTVAGLAMLQRRTRASAPGWPSRRAARGLQRHRVPVVRAASCPTCGWSTRSGCGRATGGVLGRRREVSSIGRAVAAAVRVVVTALHDKTSARSV
jgi:hypothetical protein